MKGYGMAAPWSFCTSEHFCSNAGHEPTLIEDRTLIKPGSGKVSGSRSSARGPHAERHFPEPEVTSARG